MQVINIEQSTLEMIVGYLTWLDQAPNVIKEMIDCDEIETAVFGQGGYITTVVAETIDEAGVLDRDTLDCDELAINVVEVDGNATIQVEIDVDGVTVINLQFNPIDLPVTQ